MEQLPTWEFLCYIVSVLIICYVTFDAIQTRGEVRKQAGLPLVGAPWPLTPRFILNTRFAWDAVGLLEEGYQKYQTRPFQIVQNDKNVVVLPHHLLQELSTLPSSVASPHGGLERDLLGSYSGLDLVLQTRLHHAVIQRKLTPRLDLMTPGLEKELSSAIRECLPDCENGWAEFQPYQVFRQVLARLSGHLIIGPAFEHKQAWEQLQVDYVENLFATIVVLRLFPAWARPVVSVMLPSYWLCGRSIATAKKLLGPTVRRFLQESDTGMSITQDPDGEQFNILSWLVDSVKGSDRDPDTLMHAMIIVALASLHTVLLRVVNVLYDLTDNPGLLDEIRAEMETVSASSQTWNDSYDKLHKLDSVIVESQRTSPPTTTGLKRLFRQPYTFQSGLHVPKGTYVCMPIYAIENDPANTPHPEVFDGLRQYRVFKQATQEKSANASKLQFASPTTTILNFGYGKAACPGRFFASLEIKMIFVKLLTEYDFKFLPGAGRPSNMMVHEFLFTWPWTKMLVKRKQGVDCPF